MLVLVLDERPCLANNKGIYSFLFIVILLKGILRTVEKNIEVAGD